MKNEAMVGSNSKRFKRALALGLAQLSSSSNVQVDLSLAESQSVGAVCRSARVKQRSSLQSPAWRCGVNPAPGSDASFAPSLLAAFWPQLRLLFR